jgi:hypothetical protein
MNEPRVYKHSAWNLILLSAIFGILFVVFLIQLLNGDWTTTLPILLVFGVIFSISLFSITSKTVISEDEISAQNILGTKTLRWSEINRVSGRGFSIKLHNFDGDMTVAPNSQLPGYEEVIEMIGAKRPDLFNPQEYGEMSKSWMDTLLLPIFGLLAIGFGIFIFIDSDGFIFPVLIAFIVGFAFIGMTLAAPQAVSIQGNSIVVGYLFNQKTLRADEIASVSLNFTKTRNGKNYFVAINPKSGKTIRISGLSPSLPVAYLVLKNWHKKNS